MIAKANGSPAQLSCTIHPAAVCFWVTERACRDPVACESGVRLGAARKKRRVSRGFVWAPIVRCNVGTASAVLDRVARSGSVPFFAAFLVGLWCKINGAFFSLPPLSWGRSSALCIAVTRSAVPRSSGRIILVSSRFSLVFDASEFIVLPYALFASLFFRKKLS